MRRGGEDGQVSNLWYRLRGRRRAWVSALYVRNLDRVPAYCGDGHRDRGRVTTRLLVRREAPTSRSNAHGALRRGDRVRILCKLHGQRVAGNSLWYNLPHGLWVSARYVRNVGTVPAYCTG